MNISKTYRWAKRIVVLAGGVGVLVTWCMQVWQVMQSDKHQRDESYSRVLGNLAHENADQRLSATIALASFAEDSDERRRSVITVLSSRLMTERQQRVVEATVSVLGNLGTDVIPELVDANRRSEFMLARSCGRYIGLKLIDKFPRPLPKSAIEIDFKKVREFEMDQLYEVSTRVAWFPWPFEERLSEDASFLLNLQYLVNIAGRNYSRDAQSAYDKEKNTIWGWQVAPTADSLEGAAKSIEDSARSLIATSMAIEKVLRTHSGKFRGADLSRVKLVGIDLTGVNLSYTDFSGSDLSTVRLSHSDLTSSNLTGVLFPYTSLKGISLRNANLKGADFGESQPIPTIYGSGGQVDHTLTPNKIQGTVPFEEERLEGADFSGANWWEIAEHSWAVREALQKRFPRKPQ